MADTDSGLDDARLKDTYAEADLQKLGYKQEMTRTRGLFHMLFIILDLFQTRSSSSSPFKLSWPSPHLSSEADPRLSFGGKSPSFSLFRAKLTTIDSWVLVSFLTFPLACSLGEICAKYPTSAGAYYWCFRLAPPKHRLLVSWINGWLTMVGVWTVSLSVTFGTAQLVVAGAGIYAPDLGLKPWHTYVIFLGVTAVTVFFCIFGNSILPTIDTISAYWTLLGVIVILVATSAKAASGRHSAAFALGHFDASPSGWTPGWGFFIGLLPPGRSRPYTFSAIGMIASMAEEVHDPSHDLPRAITWSIPIGFLTGVVFLVPLLFTLPDIATLLAVTSGQPIGVMFELIMGSKGGGFGLWFIIFGIGMFCAISISCAASRATWAFARDSAIPFPSTFSRVNPHLGGGSGVPLNAILLSTTIQLLLGLIYLGSSAAFNAFVGVAVMCLGASYAMPVALSLYAGRSEVRDSPFSLGRWGPALNGLAVLWVVFEMVLFSMPAVVPVTTVSMNYASVVFVGFGTFSGVWYLVGGRHRYKGPPLPESDTEAESPREIEK
ncbi:Amino acid transporter [Mycena chlorophos]|uniref:Amino acid transporter n=1 Tax=Mycena chlorophos TaxID=658473 RepID=A0A8H6TQV6_MYCCL|nr:Amino acid transporter [Mycena chlorophos]